MSNLVNVRLPDQLLQVLDQERKIYGTTRPGFIKFMLMERKKARLEKAENNPISMNPDTYKDAVRIGYSASGGEELDNLIMGDNETN